MAFNVNKIDEIVDTVIQTICAVVITIDTYSETKGKRTLKLRKHIKVTLDDGFIGYRQIPR